MQISTRLSPKLNTFGPIHRKILHRQTVSYERISNAVFNLVKENKGKTIAIASHGAVTRCLLCKLIYDDIEHLNDVVWCDNTAVTKIVFDENLEAKIEYINDTSHLPDEYLPSGSKIASYIQRDLK